MAEKIDPSDPDMISGFLQTVLHTKTMSQRELEESISDIVTPRIKRTYSFCNTPDKKTELQTFRNKLQKTRPGISDVDLAGLMRVKYIGYGNIHAHSYPVMLFFHGQSTTSKALKNPKNFKLVPQNLLPMFHAHLTWRDFTKMTSSDIRTMPVRVERSKGAREYLYPTLDPRWVVSKWGNTTKGRKIKRLLLKTKSGGGGGADDSDDGGKRAKSGKRQGRNDPESTGTRTGTSCLLAAEDLEVLGIPPPTVEEYKECEFTRLPADVWNRAHVQQIERYVKQGKEDGGEWDPMSLINILATTYHPQEALERPLHMYCNEFRPLGRNNDDGNTDIDLEARILENEAYCLKYKTEAGDYFLKLLSMLYMGETMPQSMYNTIVERLQ